MSDDERTTDGVRSIDNGRNADDARGHRDPDLSTDERVEDLLGRMTLAEKLAQLGGVWSTDLDDAGTDGHGFSAAVATDRIAHGIGQVTRVAGATAMRPRDVARRINQIQRWLVEHTRLGIPAIVHEEALAGFCARDAVQFPQAIGLAATWDRALLAEVAGHIATEMTAVGARQALAPVLDIVRDPRWGRVEETYGEDPVLTGELAVAYIRGLQSGTSDGVIATAKHFVGYGASDGGLNHGPVQLGTRELREVYAEPFAAAIRDAELASVMTSYASVDGLAPTTSRALLTDVLRDELGFTGTVVTDYFAIDLLCTYHRVAPTKAVAAARAILAGTDVELPALDGFAALPPLVEAGVVPEGVVDLAVRRVLRQKFELGLFDSPFVNPDAAASAFGTPAGRDLARRAARDSMVLLTNDGVLPVDPASLTTIAVLGPAADDPRLLQGDYHYPSHLEILTEQHEHPLPGMPDEADPPDAVGPTDRTDVRSLLPPTVTPLQGLRDALAGGLCQVLHAPGCSISGGDPSRIDAAVELAESADLAVVCLGGRSGLTRDATVGEMRDATDLDLTGVQLDLLRAVHASGTPTVAVVISGRVHTLVEVEQHSAATLLAWVPGIEGGAALADLLLGKVAPSGRLPISLPRSVGQLPVHHNHRAGGGRSQFWGEYTDSVTSPLHPFGHGLSTTTFEYGDVEVVPGSTTEPTTLRVAVANTGARDGVEVVQCYVRDEVAGVARPDRQLVGFARVPLGAGEQRAVCFTLHPSRLAFFDEAMDLVCEPGAFTVELGGCAGSPEVSATFDLDGHVAGYRQRDIVATTVTIT